MNTGLEAIKPAEICRGLFCVSGLGCLFGVGGLLFSLIWRIMRRAIDAACLQKGGPLVKNLYKILLLNMAGILLFLSWYPPQTGYWYVIDSQVFFFFNHLLTESQAFLYLVAFTNLRPFDVAAFLFMLGIFIYYYRQMDTKGRHWMLAMGATMLITAVIAKQFDLWVQFDRPSATKFFSDAGVAVNKVSQLTGWNTKDYSASSFPGDHGTFLMIFTFFMWRYLGRRAFLAGLAVVLVFSLPRIMSGAHWVSDVYVGAVSVNLIVLSWMLLTPASDWIIHRLMKLRHWE